MARPVKPKSGVSQKVVSLKVTLRDTKPPVWRRLLVPGETTLVVLHGSVGEAHSPLPRSGVMRCGRTPGVPAPACG